MTKSKKIQQISQILKELFPNPICELNYKTDYELLFAVIMSAQTTDKQINKLTNSLFEKYTSLNQYSKANESEFAKDINSIGLYNAKAKNIIASAKLLISNHDSKVPDDFAELQKLPGAGRKTANVVSWVLFGKNYGMAIDTHVARLAIRLGLSKKESVTEIEKSLTSNLPQEEWGDFGHRMILYGRYYWSAKQVTHSGPLNQFALKKFRMLEL